MSSNVTLMNFEKETIGSCGKFTVIFKDGSRVEYMAKSIGDSTDIDGFLVIATPDGTDIQSLINKDTIKEIMLEDATEEEINERIFKDNT